MLRMIDDDIENIFSIVPDIYDFFYKVVSVFVWWLLCDVIWALPECNPLLRAHMTS